MIDNTEINNEEKTMNTDNDVTTDGHTCIDIDNAATGQPCEACQREAQR